MTVTDRSRGAGSWEVTLRPDVPAEVRRQLDMTARQPGNKGYAMCVVTPQRVDVGNHPPLPAPWSVPPILDLAQWAGVVLDTSSRRGRLSGEGLLAYLADSSGVGHYHLDWADKTAREDASTLVTALLDGGTLTNTLGGGAPGDVTLSSSPLVAGTIHACSIQLTIGDQLLTTREWLSDVSSMAGRRTWRVHPTGRVDWGTRAQLWPESPRIVAGRLPAGDDQKWVTFRSTGDWGESIVGYADRAVADPGPTVGTAGPRVTASPTPAFWSPIRGGALVRSTQVPFDPDETTSDWTTRATEALDETNTTSIEATELTGEVTPTGPVTAGEPMWLYDAEAGLVDPANTITYAGEEIHPVARWIEAVTWPLVPPMGVYVLHTDTTVGSVLRLLDLTDWVAWDTDPAVTLEVGGTAPVL